ncbi:hypothetical protein TYRP_017038 [Tyrophagus putrescentiae]|nr:hypothetical protein TYRP_017038 [Tyrophagus putrescentiae]
MKLFSVPTCVTVFTVVILVIASVCLLPVNADPIPSSLIQASHSLLTTRRPASSSTNNLLPPELYATIKFLNDLRQKGFGLTVRNMLVSFGRSMRAMFERRRTSSSTRPGRPSTSNSAAAAAIAEALLF